MTTALLYVLYFDRSESLWFDFQTYSESMNICTVTAYLNHQFGYSDPDSKSELKSVDSEEGYPVSSSA